MTINEIKERFSKISEPRTYILFDLLYDGINYSARNKVPTHCGNPNHTTEWRRLDDVLANRRGCSQCKKDDFLASLEKGITRKSREEMYENISSRCLEDEYEFLPTKEEFLNARNSRVHVKCLKCGDNWSLEYSDFIIKRQNHRCNIKSLDFIKKHKSMYVEEYQLIPIVPKGYAKNYVGLKDKIQWRCLFCGKVHNFSMGDVTRRKVHCTCREYGANW